MKGEDTVYFVSVWNQSNNSNHTICGETGQTDFLFSSLPPSLSFFSLEAVTEVCEGGEEEKKATPWLRGEAGKGKVVEYVISSF